MRNISFYEFLNCRPVGTGAIDETTKIAHIGGATESKHLAQEALFLILIRIHHSRFPSHITVPLHFIHCRFINFCYPFAAPQKGMILLRHHYSS